MTPAPLQGKVLGSLSFCAAPIFQAPTGTALLCGHWDTVTGMSPGYVGALSAPEQLTYSLNRPGCAAGAKAGPPVGSGGQELERGDCKGPTFQNCVCPTTEAHTSVAASRRAQTVFSLGVALTRSGVVSTAPNVLQNYLCVFEDFVVKSAPVTSSYLNVRGSCLVSGGDNPGATGKPSSSRGLTVSPPPPHRVVPWSPVPVSGTRRI